MCETKQQVCYSKKTINAAGENTKLFFFFFFLNIKYIFRKTTTVQSWLFNASTIDGELDSTSTMSVKQSRRKNNMREILSSQFMQPSGHKVL